MQAIIQAVISTDLQDSLSCFVSLELELCETKSCVVGKLDECQVPTKRLESFQPKYKFLK